jgi:hypothetical protein
MQALPAIAGGTRDWRLKIRIGTGKEASTRAHSRRETHINEAT